MIVVGGSSKFAEDVAFERCIGDVVAVIDFRRP